MKHTCTYLDIDGVLADFHSATFALFGVDADAIALIDEWDSMPRVLSEALGRTVTERELWSRVDHEGARFWSTLSWLPWGRELFAAVDDAGPSVLMSSAGSPYAAAGKIQWIQHELPKAWTKRYALTTGKHHMAHSGALLIDDGQHNVDAFLEHGGMAYLWPAPWNDRAPEYHADPSCRFALSEVRELLAQLR